MTKKKMDKVLERIKKLIALSKSSNENEAAIALERAQEMLAEYNLTLDDIADADDPDIVVDAGKVHDIMPYRRWVVTTVAELYFCEGIYTHVLRRSKSGSIYKCERIVIVGARHNAMVARLMYEYIVKTIDRLARESAAPLKDTRGYWSYQTSFKEAAALRIAERINERIDELKAGTAPAQSDGSTLPALKSMYDQALAVVQQAVAKHFGEIEESDISPQLKHRSGAEAGLAAGDSIGLETQITGKAAQHLLT